MKNVAKIVLGHPNCRVDDELGIEYIYMHVNVCIYLYIHVFFKLPFSKASGGEFYQRSFAPGNRIMEAHLQV